MTQIVLVAPNDKLQAAFEDAFRAPEKNAGKEVWDNYKQNSFPFPMDELYEKLRFVYHGYTDIPSKDQIISDAKEIVKEHDAKYNFDKQIMNFCGNGGNAFLSEISRWVRKREDNISTAAMGYDPKQDEFYLCFGRGFMSLLDEAQHSGVIKHELFHLVFKHVTSRRRDPHSACNMAMDLAINSLIAKEGGKLPACVLMPGVRPKPPTGRNISKERKEAHELFADVIQGAPQLESSEYYFELFITMAKQKGYEWTKKGLKIPGEDDEIQFGEFDDHDDWDSIPEEIRGIVEGKIRSIVEKAVNRADSSNGWGNIPESIREEIRANVSDAVDWRTLLSRFPGKHIRGRKKSSLHKINKRYPLIHPGRTTNYVPLVLIAVDQSGSVDDNQLEEVASVLGNLARKTTFHIINFDTEVDNDSFSVWRKGTKIKFKRTRCGGTDFDSVNKWMDEQKRNNVYDCVVVCTDGECSKPASSKIPRAWVITRNHKLNFEPDTKDIVINMDDRTRSSAAGKPVR